MKPLRRFWEKVKKGPRCWEWSACRGPLVKKLRQEHVPYRTSYASLAKKYGVNKETVARAVRGDFWAHVI